MPRCSDLHLVKRVPTARKEPELDELPEKSRGLYLQRRSVYGLQTTRCCSSSGIWWLCLFMIGHFKPLRDIGSWSAVAGAWFTTGGSATRVIEVAPNRGSCGALALC